MFGKIAQFKSFLTHAVTSLTSQRPSPPSDPHLDRKIKFLLDYILRVPSEDQFKAYHSLQSPQLTINELLKQIYYSQSADTSQINSIIHFFTFLLINCHNQLVLCKIVSDGFVLELTQIDLNSLGNGVNHNNLELEEINSYKIALIKAYVSTITPQTIKYMIINDQMRIFENCVCLYEQYMGAEDQMQFGVESTCISNCILLIIKFLANHPQNSLEICNREGKKGVVYLLIKKVQHIHKIMLQILNSSQEDAYQFQDLKDKILFLIDIFHSISVEKIKAQVISQTSKELADMRELFKQIVLQHTTVLNQFQQNYLKNLQLIKVILKLLAIYHDAEALLPIFEECSLPLLNKFINVFRTSCQEIYKESTHIIETEDKVSEKELQKLLSHKNRVICIFCSNMQILAYIIKSGQYLFRRNDSQQKQQQFKTVITNILIDTIEIILSEQGQPIQDLLCFKSVKCLLLSLMQFTIQNKNSIHEYSVVKFHQFAISKLRKHLKRSQLWDYVVNHYESILKMVSSNLLQVDETQPWEYAFCQFHDASRHREPLHLDALINAILINQSSREFRFMMVERTGVELKDIKLQKNYYGNFITPGWTLQPGHQLQTVMKEICNLIHFSKGVKLPITLVQDEQCLLLSHSDQNCRKVLLNIRYKSIQGFFVEKEVVHIKLKGLQEILVQADHKNGKDNLQKVREYLSKKRDRSRQRELKFIHHYLDIYFKDNLNIIQVIGQEQIGQSSEENISSPVKIQKQELISSEQPIPQIKSVEGSEIQAQIVDDV